MKQKMKQKQMLIKLAIDLIKVISGALVGFLTAMLSSCSITRATISKPEQGTSTTVTITTNNPITTETNPTIQLPH